MTIKQRRNVTITAQTSPQSSVSFTNLAPHHNTCEMIIILF